MQECLSKVWHKTVMANRKPMDELDIKRALLIGGRIRSLREQKKYTQLQLATKVGLTSGAIGQYEIGRHLPRVRTLERLAAELNVSTEWLMTGEEPDELIRARTLTEKEALRLLRSIPVKNQQAASAMLRGLSDPPLEKNQH